MKLKLFVIVLLVVAGGAAVAYVGRRPPARRHGQRHAVPHLAGDHRRRHGQRGRDRHHRRHGGLRPRVRRRAGAHDRLERHGRLRHLDGDRGQGRRSARRSRRATCSPGPRRRTSQQQLLNAEASLRAARLQEKQAKQALDDASGTDAVRQAKVGRYNATNARREAQQQVDDLRTQIRYATLVAPIDGTITAVNIGKGLDSTGTAISLSSSTYEVTADVVESDISSMTVGQDATIAVDAIDATIQGTVSAIAPTAGDSSGSGDVVSYPVTVTLTGAPSALRAGMTADITIVTASATNVLTIPAEALRGTAGDYRVQVLGADGTPTTKAVEVGLVTSTTAEITSGLAEGEAVVTGTAADRTATSGSGNNGFSRGFGAGQGPVVVNGGPGTFTKP